MFHLILLQNNPESLRILVLIPVELCREGCGVCGVSYLHWCILAFVFRGAEFSYMFKRSRELDGKGKFVISLTRLVYESYQIGILQPGVLRKEIGHRYTCSQCVFILKTVLNSWLLSAYRKISVCWGHLEMPAQVFTRLLSEQHFVTTQLHASIDIRRKEYRPLRGDLALSVLFQNKIGLAEKPIIDQVVDVFGYL